MNTLKRVTEANKEKEEKEPVDEEEKQVCRNGEVVLTRVGKLEAGEGSGKGVGVDHFFRSQ